MGGRRFVISAVAAVVGLLVVAPAAQASFHLIKVREVFPGTVAHPNSDYVVLQMYSASQNLVQNGQLEVLDSAGAVVGTPFTPSHSVTNSANQDTVLIANSDYASQFPSGPTPDFTDSGLNLSPAGGAVCWPQTEPPFDDCASWGNFTGQASLPSPGDTAPAPSLSGSDGMAIRRSITGGACSTQLEDADDTNNSSVDFSVVTPNPRSNATTPTETTCMTATTTIDTKPPLATNSTSAAFTYHATPATGATFECKLDAGAFTPCSSSGISYPGPLSEGSHNFQVHALNASGTGPAASYTWTVDLTPPTATIDTKPPNPAPGASSTFTFHASETGSSFQCSLATGAGADSFSACTSGKTYNNLVDGDYTFKVRATDPAGNQGSPAAYTWTVQNSVPDTTPPLTTIDTKPPDPSDSSTASFTYHANETSTFECKLDTASFASCSSSGITYTGLANGSHTFQVRATDASNNVETSPPGYTFEVAVSGPPTPTPPPLLPTSPNTTLKGKPITKTHDATPTFKFGSNQVGSSFQCKVDKGPFKTCRSPFTTKALRPGRHTLKIRAIASGLMDPTPAAVSFKIVKH